MTNGWIVVRGKLNFQNIIPYLFEETDGGSVEIESERRKQGETEADREADITSTSERWFSTGSFITSYLWGHEFESYCRS